MNAMDILKSITDNNTIPPHTTITVELTDRAHLERSKLIRETCLATVRKHAPRSGTPMTINSFLSDSPDDLIEQVSDFLEEGR